MKTYHWLPERSSLPPQRFPGRMHCFQSSLIRHGLDNLVDIFHPTGEPAFSCSPILLYTPILPFGASASSIQVVMVGRLSLALPGLTQCRRRLANEPGCMHDKDQALDSCAAISHASYSTTVRAENLFLCSSRPRSRIVWQTRRMLDRGARQR